MYDNAKEDYKYAGFWVRVGASLIDVVIFMIIALPVTIMIYGYDSVLFNDVIFLGYWDVVINWIIPAAATVLFWIYKSATPGKMIFSLKVVDAQTGGNLTIKQSIGRYFAYIPAMVIFMLGIFWVMWDKKKQGWHDKLAQTVVIQKKYITKDVSFDNRKDVE